MKHIDQYMDIVASTIRHSPVMKDEVAYKIRDSASGAIEGILYFVDGSRLEFSEDVYLHQGRPVKPRYRYQYIKNKQSVFRYDNAPHHPKIPTFPHHKHVGKEIVAASEPTLGQLLDEIADLMAQ